MPKISKNTIIILSVVAILVIAGLLYLFFGINKSVLSAEVQKGDITEKINLTGQVKASQGVDLAFETSGKIVGNYVKVGEKIYAGQPLLAIDDSILQSQLAQAQAQLDALNINTVESKTNSGLQSLYMNSLSDAQKSASIAKGIVLIIADIQFNHFLSQTQEDNALQSSMARAINSLLGQPNAGLWTSQNIALLNGGAYGMVQTAVDSPAQNNIDAALLATQSSLQDVNSLVNSVPIDSSLSSTDRDNINSAQTNISSEIITTSENIQSIASQKVNNSATITTTDSQIEGAQANIDAIKTQISKTVISALFNGQVDKDNAVIGQIVSPNSPVITISNSNLEIDTAVSEIDMASVKIGDDADVTLDAYGNDVVFPATIVSIDSAPSVINGISVYGAKLKFKNFDSRIKSGMTANINIISQTHLGILMVPTSAVIQQNNKYFVMEEKRNNMSAPVEVTIGLKDDKNIEITSGLKLGDKIVAY